MNRNVVVEAAAAISGAALAAWAVRGRSSTVFAPSVWRGSAGRRAIALTFDDGPSESTPRVLEALARHGARATFFQCGANAERLPGVARLVSEQGHEIGNHTFSHPHLWTMTPGRVRREVASAQQTLERIHGHAPRWFRAPYGARWFGLREAQAAHGLTGVMWTAIALDWRLPAQEVARRLERASRPGAIFCLHDARRLERNPGIASTVRALEELLPKLAEQGYHLMTLSDLLCLRTSRGA